MKHLFLISGYGKEDNIEFINYLVSSYESAENSYEEDNVFIYGYSEKDIIKAIDLGSNTVNSFVITSYKPVAHP